MKYSRIIAIDPDLHKCGYALLESGMLTDVTSLPLWQVFDRLTGVTRKELFMIPTELIEKHGSVEDFMKNWQKHDQIIRLTKEEVKIEAFTIPTIILIEDPRLVNNHVATWHKGGLGAARNVGKCEAIAILLDEFCKAHKLNYRMIAPVGYSAFFNNEQIFQRTTGWTGKTNKDSRSASAMAWTFKDTNI